jgi:hypothetical protein
MIQEVAKRLGAKWNFTSTSDIFASLASENKFYAGLTYDLLSKTEAQWPPVGRGDLYYGGTVYDNTGGIGVRYAAESEQAGFNASVEAVTAPDANMGALQHLPRTLYQDGELIRRSKVLAGHVQGKEAEAARAAK